MKNSEEMREIIDSIISAELYEGDYGDCISNVDAIMSDVDDSDREGLPVDYLNFLAEFGFGELDAAFYMDDSPVKYSSICGREIDGHEGLYVFGGNSSEMLYAFDSKNDWTIVQISSETDDFEVVSADFCSFILGKLKYIQELVNWRAAN